MDNNNPNRNWGYIPPLQQIIKNELLNCAKMHWYKLMLYYENQLILKNK